MRYEWKVIIGAALFLGLTCTLYWFTSYEDGGTVLLLFSFCAYAMLGGFLFLLWSRRKGIPRPEDNPDGTYEEGEGVVAYFPAASIFPVAGGLGVTFVALALIFGNWYFCIGLPLLAGAMIGLMAEGEAVDHPEDEELRQHQLGQQHGQHEAASSGNGASRPHDGHS